MHLINKIPLTLRKIKNGKWNYFLVFFLSFLLFFYFSPRKQRKWKNARENTRLCEGGIEKREGEEFCFHFRFFRLLDNLWTFICLLFWFISDMFGHDECCLWFFAFLPRFPPPLRNFLHFCVTLKMLIIIYANWCHKPCVKLSVNDTVCISAILQFVWKRVLI